MYKNRMLRKLRLRRSITPLAGNSSNWSNKAFAAGCLAASEGAAPFGEERARSDEVVPHHKVNAHWSHWYHSVKGLPWHAYHQTASKFMEGYFLKSGEYYGKWLLVPTVRRVAAIVTVMNERDTISSVLEQLHRLPLHEIIFIVNGSTDESFEVIRNQSQATIVHYHHALGHDVGRAVGAKLAESEILLFLDGDFVVFAEQLVPFINAIQQGMDIALNNITPYVGPFSSRDYVTTIKEFVNRSMARAELGANSLTAIPHAMSKQAAELIGYPNLAVPPKAQVIALEKGLKVGSPSSVDVITRNRVRARNVGQNNAVSNMILGDHIEALRTALDLKGPRLSFPDHNRRRQLT
ncbi:glycosyltransferase [Cohnella sp. WQ 127256]|uniref:glycosyltransferase family 2 protein n=1 Tax=Cohnella sp. WQ 127256 TaxID=2938790 RepID=UPI002119841B|nr:glycosyltransferase [Cohnella sp. WQ 127256]